MPAKKAVLLEPRTELYQEEIAALLKVLELVDDTDNSPMIFRQIVNTLAKENVADISFEPTKKSDAKAQNAAKVEELLAPIYADIEKGIADWVPGSEIEIEIDTESLTDELEEIIIETYRKVGWEIDIYMGLVSLS